VAYLATVIIGVVLLIRKTGIPRFRISPREYIEVIKKLLPYATLVLLMSFYYRIDSVFLRYLLPDGKTQAGIYAHSFRLLDFMSNYALIFSFILLPLFAKMIRQKDQIRSLLKLSTLTLIIPSFILLSGIVFYRIEVFNLLYNSHTTLSANTFMILIMSYVGICFSYTFGALLTANGNLRELNMMAVIAVILSITLNMILIPRLKVTGAAISNGITQSFTILFHYIVVRKKFQFRFNPKLILKGILFLAFTFISGWIITQSNLNWILGCLTISLASGIFAILFRLLDISYFKTLIRFNKQE
jgi:O-antigen/teichoic acid export membrane protein